jgi:hypothetical protein
MVASVFLGVADVVTDGITCARLLHGDIPVSNERYTVAYVTILSFGVAATVLSLAHRFRNAVLLREHLLEVGQLRRKVTLSGARRQAEQHEYELVQTHRTLVILSLSLLSVMAQGTAPRLTHSLACCGSISARMHAGLPMSLLNICLVFVEESSDKMVRESLAEDPIFQALKPSCR